MAVGERYHQSQAGSQISYFGLMGVWPERLPRHEAKPRGGEIIKGRWVDTSKGDALRPGYRARLFGKEFNTGVDPALFAATPPLEAFKFRISRAAGDDRVHIMLSDLKRAYSNALARRELYV